MYLYAIDSRPFIYFSPGKMFSYKYKYVTIFHLEKMFSICNKIGSNVNNPPPENECSSGDEDYF